VTDTQGGWVSGVVIGADGAIHGQIAAAAPKQKTALD
jgi:hypothetical protein